MGAQDWPGRLLASVGQGGPVDAHFVPCADVPKAGVWVALPALLASGLWQHTPEHFQLPPGYYLNTAYVERKCIENGPN